VRSEKKYPTGLGWHESMVVLVFLLFSSKWIYKCIYQCVISLWGDVMMRKMKGEKRWTKARVKQTICYEKVRYMVIFAKMMVEAGEARGESA
jgi:hypothetical protein